MLYGYDIHINKILKDYGVQPTKLEPCLFSCYIDNYRALFLNQVKKDFAVAAKKDLAEKMIYMITDKIK